jgi:hypothetical protein
MAAEWTVLGDHARLNGVSWGHWCFCKSTESHFVYEKRQNFTSVSSESIMICTIESRRIRWMGHVARLGDVKNAYEILVGESPGKSLLDARGQYQYGSLSNLWDLETTAWGQGPVAVFYEHIIDCSLMAGNFFTGWLTIKLSRIDLAPWSLLVS